MSRHEFVALVLELREAQRAWFARKRPEDLTRAKYLERRVDEVLREIAKGQSMLPLEEDEA